MKKIKSVHDGFEPWEVLYDLIMFHSEHVWFHMSHLVSIVGGIKSIRKGITNFVKRGQPSHFFIQNHGGELLTRTNEKYLPHTDIGKAFGTMPLKELTQMFPILLLQQLEFVASLNIEKNVYYSINLEGVSHDMIVWKEVCDLLKKYRKYHINLEIKENAMLSPRAMAMLADVCKETDMCIYIDDLCACCHILPENEEYLVMVIEILHEHIYAVKVDYNVMKNIFTLQEYHIVKKNLYDFLWLWNSWCDSKSPIVIFESMPRDNKMWLERLEQLAEGYKSCRYQKD